MNLDDPQISFRKQFLSVYISKVFKSDFENPVTWVYFDKVAEMHTGELPLSSSLRLPDSSFLSAGLAGFKHRASKDPLVVDLQPMALLLGWVEDVVLHAVMELPNDVADIKAKTAVLSAFNKLSAPNSLPLRHRRAQQTLTLPTFPLSFLSLPPRDSSSPAEPLPTCSVAPERPLQPLVRQVTRGARSADGEEGGGGSDARWLGDEDGGALRFFPSPSFSPLYR